MGWGWVTDPFVLACRREEAAPSVIREFHGQSDKTVFVDLNPKSSSPVTNNKT